MNDLEAQAFRYQYEYHKGEAEQYRTMMADFGAIAVPGSIPYWASRLMTHETICTLIQNYMSTNGRVVTEEGA